MLYGGSVLIFAMMFLTTLDIVRRALTGKSIEGLFEGVELLLVAAVYLGVANVQSLEKHVRVEMLIERLSPKLQRAAEVLTMALAAIFFGVTIVMTGRQAWQSWLIREVTFLPAQHPVWLARIVVTVGLFFLWLRIVIQIGQRVGYLAGNAPEAAQAPPSDDKKEESWMVT
jgi:TRAP-type C4-dicarboxylate transport system permease small subunit